MALISHPFIGGMNLDDPVHKVPAGFNIGCRNIIWRGTQNNRRAESVLGTTPRINVNIPAGVNKCIGCWYDPVNQQIYDWNYNSNGNHGIYIYSTQTKIWQTLIQTGINTVGDPLGFTASGRINSVALIYGDDNSGNLLCFIDSLRRPTKINVQRYLAGTYINISRSFIDLIKAPPQMPPRVTYENDSTVSVNNLKNALFKFRYRFVYDDNDKSVYSSASIVALPNQPFAPTTEPDPTLNARISTFFSTGDVTVKKIELWMQQITDNTVSAWQLVKSFDKTQLSIPSLSIYKFLFYNDGVYTAGDQKEIDLLFDYVPLGANCMVLLNGNVFMFGGITEGYNPVPLIQMSSSVNLTYQNPVNPVNGVLFFAAQGQLDSNGTGNQITLYLTGTGANDGSGNPTTIPIVGGVGAFVVDCATSTGTSLKFSYDNLFNVTTIPGILNALQVAAVANGFTFVSSTTNSVTLSYPGVVLYSAQVKNSIGNLGLNEAVFAYPYKSAYEFALEYLDQDGRTIGAQVPLSGGINIPDDLTGLTSPQISVSISHRPPAEAFYYHLVRSLNETYAKRTNWICNQTFTNVDLNNNNKYAYIGISNMVEYNQNIQAATPVVSYEFNPGDRIQFQIAYPIGSPQVTLLSKNDYEIVSVQPDPVINGIIQRGRFIKILYPAADVNANFDFGGDPFQRYKILIYSYVKHPTSNQQTVYFEFDRTYSIGNPGTNAAFHIGSDQTQKADLSQPAIINSTDGDFFQRERLVPTGIIYYPNVIQAGFSNHWVTLPTNNEQGVIDNSSYQIGQQVGAAASPAFGTFPTIGDGNQLFWNKLGTPVQLRVRTDANGYTITGDKSLTHKLFVKVVTSTNATLTYLVKTFFAPQSSTNTHSYTLFFDEYVAIPANAKAWVIATNESVSGVSNQFVGGFTLKLDVLNTIAIPIIESSFSDKYNIVTNSNSRPIVYEPNAGQFYYTTKVRWTQAYQLGTSLNNSNRVYPQDFDEFDKSFGDIMRMITRQREVDIFQKRKCGHIGVYARFVRNNQGQDQLLATDVIITPNNIQYYIGDFGVGNQPDAISVSGFQRYFCDPVKGFICRLSLDGIQPISEIFKVQTWSGINLTNYLQNYSYAYGGNSVILGAYNINKDREGESLFSLQAGSSGLITLPAQTISFNEQFNHFQGFFDYAPDALVCAENLLFSFSNGVMYSHDNTTAYANFYGSQKTPQIIKVFNDFGIEKKTWLAISQVANVPWNAPLIYTETETYPGQRQESKLIDQNFSLLEGVQHAAFLRDIRSQKGWINGDFLHGTYLVAQLQVSNPQNFVFLSEVSIKWADSPLTAK